MIPPSEVARRLCMAAHPMFASTGNPVPCGTHIGQAQRLWGLLGDEGTKALAVILQIRAENGAERVEGGDALMPVSIREPETSDDVAASADDYSGTPV